MKRGASIVVPETENNLWKVSEVAAFLRLSPKAVYQLVEDRALPYLRIGWRIRFDPKVLSARVAGRSIEPQVCYGKPIHHQLGSHSEAASILPCSAKGVWMA